MTHANWMAVSAFSGAMFVTSQLFADAIELTNGDVLNGKVITLDETHLTLKSDILGELKVDRGKVSAIHLGEKAKVPAKQPVAAATPAPAPVGDPAVQKLLNSVPSSDEVMRQLQGGKGVDPQMIGALQTKFPLLNNPEAKTYFNDTLGGLMTGRLNIQDIRKDAVNARDQLKDLQDELGPNGAALNGYMSILNNFINETEPPPANTPEPKPEKREKNAKPTFPPKN